MWNIDSLKLQLNLQGIRIGLLSFDKGPGIRVYGKYLTISSKRGYRKGIWKTKSYKSNFKERVLTWHIIVDGRCV